MIIDANNIEGNVLNTDICVVGGGVAGLTFAREFKNSDLDVVVLESGGKVPNDDIDISSDVNNIGLPYDKHDRRVRAIGGESHAWFIPLTNGSEGLRLRSLDSLDFEKRDWIPYSGWPITKADLDPYYIKAHKLFEIGPYRYDAEFWENEEINPQLQFKNGVIKTTIFHFAKKNIFTTKVVNEVEKCKNVKIYTDATVLNVNLNEPANHVKHVIAKTLHGKEFKVNAKYFILALGGLETPRLLLLSRNIMKSGIGNQNDLVGRFFMEHPHPKSGVFYPSKPDFFKRAALYEMQNRKGVPIMGKLALSENTIRGEKLLNFVTALNYTPMVGLMESDSSVAHIARAIKNWKIPVDTGYHLKKIFKNIDIVTYVALRKIFKGDKEKWYNTKYKFHGYILDVMSEQIPDPQSRVMLDKSRDRFGQNKIKLNWKLNAQDINSIRRSQEIIDRELRKNKLGRIEIEMKDESIPDGITGGWHHMGTTRMNSDPKQGVVDENCLVYDTKNLFIAGPSLFTTSGYANPTLTSVALSIRLADYIKLKAIR